MLNLIGRALAATVDVNIGSGSSGAAQGTNLPVLRIFTGTGGIRGILANIINGVLVLAGAIAVIYLIYGGILYTTAGGNSEQADKGKATIINAVIGIVIIFVAIILVNLVTNVLTSGSGGV